MKLASFDIFDTALIRRCGKAATIFHLTARRLFPADEARAGAFMAWRKQAEMDACRKNKNSNIRFEHIYEGLDEESFGVTREDAAAMEKQIEHENLVVNPAVREVIEQKRKEGYTVCFISDMYLDADFLREVLTASGLILAGEEIFVSCEWGCRKSTGKLFGTVREKYHPARWEHYGDNYISDFLRPEKLGIRAVLVNTDYTQAEKKVEERYKYSRLGNDISAFVGFQRAARIAAGNTSYSEIAADFVASAYIPYVRYVLEQARLNGIKRLYFINRDGYILLRIAEMFATEYPEIELRYIFISRKAIAAASLVGESAGMLARALNPPTLIGKKCKGLLKWLDIDLEELKEAGIEFDYDRITNSAQAKEFAEKLFHSAYTPAWQETAAHSREIFKLYLDQEGVTDGTKNAMVDVGWYGSTRLMLNKILDSYDSPRSSFFYFSAADNSVPLRYGEYFSYTPYALIENSGLISLMEHYYSASPYGSVVSFEENTERIAPILDKGATTPEYARIIEANIDAAQEIISCMKGLNIDHISEALYVDYLQIMKEQRVKVNLEALTAVGDAADPDGSSQAFVRKIGLVETVGYAFMGKHITAFDKAAVVMTFGNGVAGKLFRLHDFSCRAREFLYAKYMASRQK